jgi:hypothetical protein
MLLLVMLVATGLVAWGMPNDLTRGLVLGGGLVGAPMTLWLLTLQLTGTATIMMGDEAEQWTAQALRRLQRSGWRLVNHVALTQEDIDHILLGPGGVYAVETKWSSGWNSRHGQQQLHHAINQAAANARRLQLWHPLKRRGITVTPLVVVWGPETASWPADHQVQTLDGVTVVRGTALKAWTRALPTAQLHDSEVQALWVALDQHITRRDPRERANRPVPPSLPHLVTQIGLGVSAAALGLIFVTRLLSWTGSESITSVASLLAVAPALPAHRASYLKWPAVGWALGVLLPVATLIIAYGFQLGQSWT